MTAHPVSYTHLDVYKRQILFVDTKLYRRLGEGLLANRKSPLQPIDDGTLDFVNLIDCHPFTHSGHRSA